MKASILLAALVAAGCVTSAEGKPRHRAPPAGVGVVTEFCGDLYCPVGVARSGPVRIEITLKRERRASRSARAAGHYRAPAVQAAPGAPDSGAGAPSGPGGGALVAEARRYLGGNPTGRSSLWCAAFMNLVLERSGRNGTGSNMASSFARYGTRVSGPVVGAIAVMSRGRRGGHVGIVSGIDSSGNPIIISGNHGRRVAESTYSRGRIYAYVMP